MLDIGWHEIFVIGVLALIVVGPKDLPRVLRTATQYMRKARGLAREFQNGINEVVREAELEDLKKQVTQVKDFDPGKALGEMVDPDSDLGRELQIMDGAAGLELEKEHRERQEKLENKGAEEAVSTPPSPPPPAKSK